jgi:transposase
MLTVGLDVHFRKSSLCLLDEHGKVLGQKQLTGTWSAVIDELKRIEQPFQICYEASLGYGHLFDQIKTLPHAKAIQVAHPGQLRLIYKSRRKNDRVDSRKLATLCFLDQVPQVHVPSLDTRSWRGLIEWRQKIVGRRVMVKNQIRSLLKGCGIVPLKKTTLWSQKGTDWLKEQVFPMAVDALRRDMLLEELAAHDGRIKKLDKALNDIGRKDPRVALLQTIPGVGPRTAEAFVAYVDDPKRFRNVSCIGSYLGLVPCQDASGSTNRLGHITREGPATLRKLLTEASWQGILRDPTIKKHYEAIYRNDPTRRRIALIATARWLSVVMLSMLRSNEGWRTSEPADQKPTAATPKTTNEAAPATPAAATTT